MHCGVGPSLIHVCACIVKYREAASACLYHSVPNWISCTTECISLVFFKIFRNDCCPHVLITSSNAYACADNGPMYGGKKRDVMPLLDMLNALEKAMSSTAVGCHYSANGWAVHQEKWIQGQEEHWGHCYIKGNTFLCESSYCLLKKVERALCLWLEDATQEGLSSVGLLWERRSCHSMTTKHSLVMSRSMSMRVKAGLKTLISR